ncbi:MAG: hypothetical protein M1816_000345 [Peltula sp. TS41687]|nr:MAG: hypothetical protein M1816_000345 [Peltula sp. TS41687]
MSPTIRAVPNSSSTSSTSSIDEHLNKKAKHLSNIVEGSPLTDELEHASLPTPSPSLASALSHESEAQGSPKDWEERLHERMRQDQESCRRRGEEELRKLGISPLPPIQLSTSDEERDEKTPTVHSETVRPG